MAGDEPGGLLPSLVGGIVVGLVTAVNALAYAGLIYRGPLAPGLLVGLSALLAGAAVSTVAIALLAECPGLVAAPLASTAVVYALIPAALGDRVGMADPFMAAQRVAALSGVVSLAAGAIYWLLGRFRIGGLARFLPYPVVGGYNAGIGWLFVLAGVALGTDLHPHGMGWAALAAPAVLPKLAACLGVGIAMTGLSRRSKHWAIVPGGVIAAVLGFHAARIAAGASLGAARHAGWLLGPFPPGRIFSPLDWRALTGVGWPVAGAVGPIGLTIALVGVTTAIMMLSGLEVELHRGIDTNAELRATGIATAGAGLFGGIVASPSLASTTLAHRMGARGRMAGVLVGLCCVAVLLAGTGVLNVIPRFAIGALLVFNGLDRLVDRVWLDRRRLPPLEWAALLLVLLTVAWAGLLDGVAMGLGLTLVIFIWNYRAVSVIRLAASGAAHRSSVMRPPAEEVILRRDGAAIRLLRLQAYLFFLNATAILDAMPARGTRYLVVDFRAVAGLDSSAGMTVRRMHQIARERGYAVMITGLRDSLRAQFARLGLPVASPPGVPEAATEDQALQYAENEVLAAAGTAGPAGPISLAGLFEATLGQAVPAARLAPYLKQATLARGEVLIRQGDPSDTMYVITAGQVAVRLEIGQGLPVPLATAGAGVVMGEIGFYTGVPRTATVLAEADTAVESIAQEDIARMERDDPELASLFHRLMTCLLADKLAASSRQMSQSGT